MVERRNEFEVRVGAMRYELIIIFLGKEIADELLTLSIQLQYFA